MKRPIHQHGELELYSVSDVEPVERVMQSPRQADIELPSVADDADTPLYRHQNSSLAVAVTVMSLERPNHCCNYNSLQEIVANARVRSSRNPTT